MCIAGTGFVLQLQLFFHRNLRRSGGNVRPERSRCVKTPPFSGGAFLSFV